jgi:cell wall-associated NlpC family hydrolase
VATGWDDPAQRRAFYARYTPTAQRWAQKTGVPASMLLAALAHESDFGRVGPSFGIHGPGPGGTSTVRTDTTAAGQPYQVGFATYRSDDEAFAHFFDLIATAPRYQGAWRQFQKDRNAAALFDNITQAGYAEDKSWGRRVAGAVTDFVKREVPDVDTARSPQEAFAAWAQAKRAQGYQPASYEQALADWERETAAGGAGAIPDQGSRQPDTAQNQDPAKAVFGALYARGQKELGKRYAGPVIGEPDTARWGTPGWDCSSFVSGVFKDLGVQLTPFTDAAGSDRESRKLKPSEARPGDVVFYRGAGSGGNPAQVYSHMGIYLGDGKMIDASTVGVGGVAVRDVNMNVADFRRPHAVDSPEGLAAVAKTAVGQGARANMVQYSATGSAGPAQGGGVDPFIQGQLGQAQKDLQYWLDRRRQLMGKATPTKAEQDELEAITTEELPAAQERYGAFQALAQKAAAGGDSPAQLIAAQAGMLNAQTGQATALAGIAKSQFDMRSQAYDQYLKLVLGQMENELGLAGLQKDLLGIYESGKAKAAELAIARGNLSLNGVAAVVEAQAKQQVAEMTRAAEVLARTKLIDEISFRNTVRRLPPGVNYAPGLAPDEPLAQALNNVGLAYKGLRVTPVDWEELAPERSIARAEATVPPVGDFDIDAIRAVTLANAGLPGYTPEDPFGRVEQPTWRDLTTLAPKIPAPVDLSDYEDMILGRGQWAPSAPADGAGSAGGPVAAGPAPAPVPAENRPSVATIPTLGEGRMTEPAPAPVPAQDRPSVATVPTLGEGRMTEPREEGRYGQGWRPPPLLQGPEAEVVGRTGPPGVDLGGLLREWGVPIVTRGPAGAVAAAAAGRARKWIR